MAIRVLFLMACALAASVPFWGERQPARAASEVAFPGWPATLDERALEERELDAREERFARGLPGRMARFNDGRREWTIRWVTKPTRRLHPAADCYRGLGYRIRPLPSAVDARGRTWGRFKATKGDRVLVVRERIEDHLGTSFPDVSAWYWAAILGHSPGPWWAYTSAEPSSRP